MTIMKYIDCSCTEREKQYLDYLSKHIGGVQRSYKEILRPYIAPNCTAEFLELLDSRIENHDKSKFSNEEWNAYLDHFYPDETVDKEQNRIEYDYAWLHHQKNNPHHWQYWILVKDSPEDKSNKYIPLKMDEAAIYEMLCDWSSFQYTRPGSTANKWYKDNKDQMILNEDTRNIIEKILRDCPEL